MARHAVLALLCVTAGVAAPPAAAFTKLVQKPDEAGCVTSGTVTPCALGRGLARATSVAISPDGANAYVASNVADTLAVFDRAADGTLTQKPGAAGCISDLAAQPCTSVHDVGPVSSIIVSHDRMSRYTASAINSTIARFERAADGTLTQHGDLSGCLSDAVHAGCTALRRMGGRRSWPSARTIAACTSAPRAAPRSRSSIVHRTAA